ncbi:MAG TPA: calcium-binding protein [Xanthobacteraceae bacterium]|nr:calcium-binding protein [Xanthobacteraceae bacterium]
MVRIKIGTAGDDTLTGDANDNNIILGLAGDDILTGGGLADLLVGGDGNDLLRGGGGDDFLVGGSGDDRLVGGAGNDILDGGDGRDLAIYTDATGGISVDMAAGTAEGSGVGHDVLISVERIRGSNFDDNYIATGFNSGSPVVGRGTDFNEFEGGGGDDTITGNGNTRVSYLNAAASVTVDLLAGTGQGTAPGDLAAVGFDHFTGVNTVRGSSFDDALFGSNTTTGFEQFEGRGGNDIIDGRGGLDRAVYDLDPATLSGITIDLAAGTVTGDATVGTDTLLSVEFVRGTDFADTYSAVGFSGSSANAGSNGTFNEFEGMGGNDTIIGNGNTRVAFYNATDGVTVDLAAPTPGVPGSTGVAFGTAAGDLAGIGTDTISGGVNNIVGSQFADTLLGSANAEVFDGRAGDDLINGRGGFDTAIYGNDPAVTSGISVDMVAGIVTGDATVGTDTLRAIESVRGTNFADSYDSTGGDGPGGNPGFGEPGALNIGNNGTFNEFEGLGGDDTIIGNGNTRIGFLNATGGVAVDLAAGTATGNSSVGADTFTGVANVRGSGFADTISGNAGNNVLDGQGGNDTINGRGGNDAMTGGAGDDHFVYTAIGDGLDHVLDFNGHGAGGQDDVFDFDHLAVGAGLAEGGADTGTLDPTHFVANASGATTAAEVFWYNTTNHTLYYDADGSGGGAAVAIAILDNSFLLASQDIHLI